MPLPKMFACHVTRGTEYFGPLQDLYLHLKESSKDSYKSSWLTWHDRVTIIMKCFQSTVNVRIVAPLIGLDLKPLSLLGHRFENCSYQKSPFTFSVIGLFQRVPQMFAWQWQSIFWMLSFFVMYKFSWLTWHDSDNNSEVFTYNILRTYIIVDYF